MRAGDHIHQRRSPCCADEAERFLLALRRISAEEPVKHINDYILGWRDAQKLLAFERTQGEAEELPDYADDEYNGRIPHR